MNIGPAKTVQEAADSIRRLRNYQPYRFGGKWYVSVIKSEGVAYRNLRDIKRAAAKAGMDSVEIAIL